MNKNKPTSSLNMILTKRGGKTSARIIESLLVRPYNPNQLANALGMSYNTVKYHINIMLKYDLVERTADRYGSTYEVTPKLLNDLEKFEELKKLI